MTAPTELRLALAMRGGVSLAVWIGGCVQEIDHLRWDVEPANGTTTSNAMARLARAVGVDRVTVDVMSGASAGGLNAVIYGTAMAAGAPVTNLRKTWMRIADIASLQQVAGRRPADDEPSLLNGVYFRTQLRNQLMTFVESTAAAPSTPMRAERLDVLLSVSSVHPTETRTALDPALPEVERHIDGMVHLYHRAEDGVSDFAGDHADLVDVLADAGRSTAAFPVAFAPLRLEDGLRQRLELRPRTPLEVALYDGGVTDNMPVGKAARLIEIAPADGPTNRVLLYLHPSPGAKAESVDAAPKKATPAGPIDVIRSAAGSLRGKSLAEDLRTIKAHNASIAAQLSSRERLLQPQGLGAAPPSAVPALDAARLAELLSSPWEHLDGIVPPPLTGPMLEGRSGDFEHAMVDRVTTDLQFVLDTALANAQTGGTTPIPVLPDLAVGSVRPWSPIIRTASVLIEWFNRLQMSAGPSSPKTRLYEIRAGAYREASQLNLKTLSALRSPVDRPDDSAPSWAVDLVKRRLDVLVEREEWVAIEAAWTELRQIALHIRRLAESSPTEPDLSEFANLSAALMALEVTTDPATTASLDQAGHLLDGIDRTLLPLHRGAPLGSMTRIDYRTISGQAECPIWAEYHWGSEDPDLHIAIGLLELPSLRSLTAAHPHEADSLILRNRIDPASKLAGNQLHNFAAFFDQAWRENDWLWGQADAATTLVDVLLASAGAHHLTVDAVRAIITGADAGGETESQWRQELATLGATLWTVVEPYVDAELAWAKTDESHRTTTAMPFEVTRAVLLWRRQMEIFGSERIDRAAESGLPPAAGLSDTLDAWDDEPRGLASKWGQRDLAALGVRTTSVAVREMTAERGWILWGLGKVVAAPALLGISAALGRRRTAVAALLILAGVVLPRTATSLLGRWLVAGLGVAIAGVVLVKMSDPKPKAPTASPPWWKRSLADPWAVAAVGLAILIALGAFFLTHTALESILAPTPAKADGSGVVLPSSWTRSVLVPGVAAALATFVYWFWARQPYRLLVSVINGGIVAFWVAFAAQGERAPSGVRFLESLWWPALVVLPLVATVFLTAWDVCEPIPEPADDP